MIHYNSRLMQSKAKRHRLPPHILILSDSLLRSLSLLSAPCHYYPILANFSKRVYTDEVSIFLHAIKWLILFFIKKE